MNKQDAQSTTLDNIEENRILISIPYMGLCSYDEIAEIIHLSGLDQSVKVNVLPEDYKDKERVRIQLTGNPQLIDDWVENYSDDQNLTKVYHAYCKLGIQLSYSALLSWSKAKA